MLNKVTLIGNLGRDPEHRTTQSGEPVVNFSVATSDKWTDKASGEKKERTEWHRVVCFNEHLCGIIETFGAKGQKVYIEGELRTRKWTDSKNIERYMTEVVLPRFDGVFIMLSSQKNGPPPVGSPDDYGDTKPVDGSQQPAPSQDEIPY